MFISVTNERDIWLKRIANGSAEPRSMCLKSQRTILPSRINGSFKRGVVRLMERSEPYGGMKVDKRNAPFREMSRIIALYSIP